MGEELEGPEGSGEWDRLGGSGPPLRKVGFPTGGGEFASFFGQWAAGQACPLGDGLGGHADPGEPGAAGALGICASPL